MPSPDYGTTPRYALRWLKGDSLISDIDAGFLASLTDVENAFAGFRSCTQAARLAASPLDGLLWRETDVGGLYVGNGTIWISLAGATPVVTSLPGTPYDGQEIRFLADATNGVVWHLRYRAASASAYKWEFIGGPELFSEVTTAETTASGAFTDLATVGPQLTVPLAGDYLVSIGMEASGTVGGIMSYAIGGTGASGADQIDLFFGAGVTQQASVWRTRKKTGLAAAAALVAKYRSPGGTSGAMGPRQMLAKPVRVG